MTGRFHSTAIISPKASIGQNVEIGPYSIIGDNVKIGDNVVIHSHVVIEGHTHIGDNNIFFPFCSIGHAPQDLKYSGEISRVEIGDNNIFREYVTVNPGTNKGGLLTKIGNNCLFMISAHIAHDCMVGNNVILANNATIAGHVHIGDYAVLGGLSAVHQFVRIGHHAMIGGMSGIENDVIPYGQASGERALLVGLNLIGLKRRKFSREDINALRQAYRMIFSPEGTLMERIKDAKNVFKNNNAVSEVIDFIEKNENRSICQPQKTINPVSNEEA